MPQLPRQDLFVPMQPQQAPTTPPEVAGAIGGAVSQLGAAGVELGKGLFHQKKVTDHATALLAAEKARADSLMELQQFSHDMMQPDSGVDPSQWTKLATQKLVEVGKTYTDKLKTDLKDNLYADLAGTHFQTGLRVDGLKHVGEQVMKAQDHHTLIGLQGKLSDTTNSWIDKVGQDPTRMKEAESALHDLYYGNKEKGIGPLGSFIHTPQEQERRWNETQTALHLAPYTTRISRGGSGTMLMEMEGGRLGTELTVPERDSLRHKLLTDAGSRGHIDAQNRATWEFQHHQKSEETTKTALANMQPEVNPANRYDYTKLQHDAPFLTEAHYNLLRSSLTVMSESGGPGAPTAYNLWKQQILSDPNRFDDSKLVGIIRGNGMNNKEGLDLLQTWYHRKNELLTGDRDPEHFSKSYFYSKAYMQVKTGLAPAVGPIGELLKPEQGRVIVAAEQAFEHLVSQIYHTQKRMPTEQEIQAAYDYTVMHYTRQMPIVTPVSPVPGLPIPRNIAALEAGVKNGTIPRDLVPTIGFEILRQAKAKQMGAR